MLQTIIILILGAIFVYAMFHNPSGGGGGHAGGKGKGPGGGGPKPPPR